MAQADRGSGRILLGPKLKAAQDRAGTQPAEAGEACDSLMRLAARSIENQAAILDYRGHGGLL
jgi:hypothetical protein